MYLRAGAPPEAPHADIFPPSDCSSSPRPPCRLLGEETGAELPSGPEREAAAGRFGDSVKEASEAQTWTGVSGSGLDPSGLKWSSSVVQLNGDSTSCRESTASEEDQEHLEKEDSLAETFSSSSVQFTEQ